MALDDEILEIIMVFAVPRSNRSGLMPNKKNANHSSY